MPIGNIRNTHSQRSCASQKSKLSGCVDWRAQCRVQDQWVERSKPGKIWKSHQFMAKTMTFTFTAHLKQEWFQFKIYWLTRLAFYQVQICQRANALGFYNKIRSSDILGTDLRTKAHWATGRLTEVVLASNSHVNM